MMSIETPVERGSEKRMNELNEPVGRSGRVPVSVIVPVKNEAANLKRCLPALAWADEIFVVDSQSTDETAAVAAEFGAEVVQFHWDGRGPKKKNWALDHLPFRNEWVLIVDADEVVTPALAGEIGEKIARNEADGYYLNMLYWFLGRMIRHCGYNECWNMRLFKHYLGRYERLDAAAAAAQAGDNEAHEHVILRGKSGRLREVLEHHAYPTISVWLEKHNRYAAWEAALQDHFVRSSPPQGIGWGKWLKRQLKRVYLVLPLRPVIRFVYAYFLRLGFLDGRPGLIFCGLLAVYDFLCIAKRAELQWQAGVDSGDGGAGSGVARRSMIPAHTEPA